ncbi:MAG: hypothetical protein ACR2LX_01335 [Jatrophihabitans sp.]
MSEVYEVPPQPVEAVSASPISGLLTRMIEPSTPNSTVADPFSAAAVASQASAARCGLRAFVVETGLPEQHTEVIRGVQQVLRAADDARCGRAETRQTGCPQDEFDGSRDREIIDTSAT